MRHRAKRSNFHRRPGPRLALIRGLVYSLVENGRIKTTLARAKEVRRHVEKAVTLGKKGTLHARRLLLSRFPNENVVSIITSDLQKRFAQRPGGYTRIVRIGSRPGDQSDMAFLEFVDYSAKAVTETTKTEKKAEKKGEKKASESATKKAAAEKKLIVRKRLAAKERQRKRIRKISAESRREARA